MAGHEVTLVVVKGFGKEPMLLITMCRKTDRYIGGLSDALEM